MNVHPRLNRLTTSTTTVFIVVRTVVLGGTAPDAVDEEDDDDDADVEHQQHPPLPLDAGQEPGLARVAVVAQGLRIVAPLAAVTVGHPRRPRAQRPVGHVLELEPAVARRFAATRLNKLRKKPKKKKLNHLYRMS